MVARGRWPPWWEWDLELTPHLLKRMVDRGFTEVDLREMLEKASDYRRDVVEGRFAVDCRRRGERWEAIVEPDASMKHLVVVTAYPLGRPTDE